MENPKSEFKIESFLEFDYFRETFLASFKDEKTPYKFALGLVDAGFQFPKPDVLLYSTQEEYDKFRFFSALVLDANLQTLKDLKTYLEGSTSTNLLSVIFGLATNDQGEKDNVLIVTASEVVANTFVIFKGERVAKGERVVFDKGGQRVSVDINF